MFLLGLWLIGQLTIQSADWQLITAGAFDSVLNKCKASWKEEREWNPKKRTGIQFIDV